MGSGPPGTDLPRRARRPLVCGPGFRRTAAGGGRPPPAGTPTLHPYLCWPLERAGDRPRRAAGPAGARAAGQGVLRQFRLRGGGYRHQAHLVLQQRPRPAGEEAHPRPPARLSRRHRRRRSPHGPALCASGLRSAHEPPVLPPHAAEPLSRGAAGRGRGGLHRPARRRTGCGDPRPRAGDGGGLHRRAGDGCRRRGGAAGLLFRQDPAHPAAA